MKSQDDRFKFKKSDTETKSVVQKIAFYSEYNPIVFVEVIKKYAGILSPILASLKFYMLPESYQGIVQLLKQQSSLKRELEDLQQNKTSQHKAVLAEYSRSKTDTLEDLNYCILLLKFYATTTV